MISTQSQKRKVRGKQKQKTTMNLPEALQDFILEQPTPPLEALEQPPEPPLDQQEALDVAAPRSAPSYNTIDLTATDDEEDEDVVMLSHRKKAAHMPSGHCQASVDVLDLRGSPVIPVNRPEMPQLQQSPPQTTPQSPEAAFRSSLRCPVCLETFQSQIKEDKAIFTTNCGHLFCENCIKGAIKNLKQCPTCRKKITTNRSIHMVYL